MLKAQMSLELMLYIALAGLSMVGALAILRSGGAAASSYGNRYKAYEFAESVNYAAESGSGKPVQVSLPAGMCNSTMQGSALSTQYGTFYLVPGIYINTSALCPAGAASIVVLGNYTYRYVMVER